MTCKACQFGLNVALVLDHFLNVLLLGDPNEVVSRRVGRARDAGKKWASVACDILSWVFGKDHCTVAEHPGTYGHELWHWSNNDSEPVL